jgi:hypothetical protein
MNFFINSVNIKTFKDEHAPLHLLIRMVILCLALTKEGKGNTWPYLRWDIT